MNRCIFCLTVDGSFSTREHILPESLGGGDWATLPDGLMCDRCQNAFGTRVEKKALADYPFNLLRTFLGIPTKKGKAPFFDCWEGRISGSPFLGCFGYDPAPIFGDSVERGIKTVIRVPRGLRIDR